jgi:multicomponent Na+:H+ antiporter subunit D
LVQKAGDSFHLERTGGLYRTQGLTAIGFLISALALAGIPPLSGFWAKLLVIRASLESFQYGMALLATLVGLLTLFSMVKIWAEVFWKPAPVAAAVALDGSPPPTPARLSGWMLAPVLGLAAIIVLLGLFMEPLIRFAETAAVQLLEPSRYVQAVMGAAP